MLSLRNIKKDYEVADEKVAALKGISLDFRKSEFVAILGPSGCGKTTLLNIIGGLDKYTEGDLVINGVSTKKYNDRDWDTYRNHSVGFVFQSYNLIPHQTVLSNVELALTLSGVNKKERRKRAKEALEKVGLGDQLNKKPNQMSGGQMQRVAIARAIVNDPEILLADEPTGALDSQTSVQVMDILKEISKDRLIIMVTHNPELAERYATRTVKLFDGEVKDDSSPYLSELPDKTDEEIKKSRKKKPSMSFFTALSLSKNNLMTKKGRTFLTSFAGSIGIIGIALILSVSTGVKNYIDDVQKDTLSNYPIEIQRESKDLSSMISALSGKTDGKAGHDLDGVYENKMMYELSNSLSQAETTENNLKAFKKYIENNEEFAKYASAVRYGYDVNMNIYTKDGDGKTVKSDAMELITEVMGGDSIYAQGSSMFMSSSGFDVWEELLSGKNGEAVGDATKEKYTLVDGKWPENYDETVLIVNERNEISDLTLYALGLKTKAEILSDMEKAATGEVVDTETSKHGYDEILGRTFRVILSSDIYKKNADGDYEDLTATEAGLSYLYDNSGTELKIVGIIRPNEDSNMMSSGGAIGYTSLLTDRIISLDSKSDLLREQLENKKTDILTGLPFKSEISDDEEAETVKNWFSSLSAEDKARIYIEIKSKPTDEYVKTAVAQYTANLDDAAMREMFKQAMSKKMTLDEKSIDEYVSGLDEKTLRGYIEEMATSSVKEQYAAKIKAQFASLPADRAASLFDAEEFSDDDYKAFYTDFASEIVSDATYDENIKKLGYIDREDPWTMEIYADSFENKDNISSLISKYNETVTEDDRINYTDYVALLMSSITTIIDAISYVLIAFVTISLVVSSIMIGIITYISVLERTKEIGILRSVGASKKDISRVFNAETLIVGFAAGVIGILLTLGLDLIVNIILHSLTGIETLNASLPPISAAILVAISMFLTFIAGLIPSKIAAKKDPVTALRTE